ncbi:DNA-directed RNA polymerase specialized sigma24 family protein [Bacillus mesophilus]|uniref:DUF4179 domain-containing protein n=1 Tax=Bacillus mesophilus TaxID=1808955 RepID=A0A6M0Q6Q5_9BACI|nr:DUF4179 domain-containing protein [Bacillus mesophilus]MBM7661033.1 DNA-directed RNA polymerase specialized sigma24 family protein [Bacillus mesophilus]NEY71429.1 DUF4179 domain-containing protein [Bacillus mesophilus]
MEVVKPNSILIENIRDKDIQTIMEWFDTKQDLYYKFISFFLNEKSEYEEVIYRVIMKVYNEIHRMKSDSSFDIWVTTILLNECLERSSKAKQENLSHSNEEIINKLRAMENDYKTPILLKYLMKMTNEEVVEILNIPISMVKSRLFSGIHLLQNAWEDVGCEEYKDIYLDYLDMTLGREKRVELEIHIRKCKSCNNMLFDFQEVLFKLYAELDGMKILNSLMDDVTERVNKVIKEKEQLKKKRVRIGSVIIACMTLVLFIGFFTNTFNRVHYTWLEWNEQEDAEMLTYLKNGLGEPLNLEAQHNGVTIKIKTAVADDYQTVLYYEVVNNNDDHNKYTINMFEGFHVQNEQEVFDLQAEPISAFRFGEPILEKNDKNVFSGKISLLPIADESGTIKLNISKLLKVHEDLDNPEQTLHKTYYNNEIETLEGKWSFEVPVTKHASIEHEVDKEIEIKGIPLTIDKLIFAPTVTLLQYKVDHSNQDQKQINDLYIDQIVKGKQKSNTLHFHSMTHQGYFQKSFDSLYFEDSEEVKIHFSSFHYFKDDDISLNLKSNGPFPQTLEYMGNEISIENIITDGARTVVTIKDAPPEVRKYESLHFDIKTDDENEQLLMNYNSNDGVWMDRDGKIYDQSDNFYDGNVEPPRYYETNYEIELFKETSDEQVIPQKFHIYGHSGTEYIDEVVELRLD